MRGEGLEVAGLAGLDPGGLGGGGGLGELLHEAAGKLGGAVGEAAPLAEVGADGVGVRGLGLGLVEEGQELPRGEEGVLPAAEIGLLPRAPVQRGIRHVGLLIPADGGIEGFQNGDLGGELKKLGIGGHGGRTVAQQAEGLQPGSAGE